MDLYNKNLVTIRAIQKQLRSLINFLKLSDREVKSFYTTYIHQAEPSVQRRGGKLKPTGQIRFLESKFAAQELIFSEKYTFENNNNEIFCSKNLQVDSYLKKYLDKCSNDVLFIVSFIFINNFLLITRTFFKIMWPSKVVF